jgi:undecaprenyl pyrophosphate synthase
VHRDTCRSDHYPTICRFTEPNPKATKRPASRTKTANWEGYQKTLTETETGEKLTIEEVTSTIYEIVTKNVKRTTEEVKMDDHRYPRIN